MIIRMSGHQLVNNLSKSTISACCNKNPTPNKSNITPIKLLPMVIQPPLLILFLLFYQSCYKHETTRSEEHTSELQSRFELVCRLLLEKENIYKYSTARNT